MMADYYDRLGVQLAELTERGPRRRRVALAVLGLRIRMEIVAVAMTLALVVAVSAVFLTLGSGHRGAGPTTHVGAGANGPPVIRNYSHRPPPPAGQIVCDTALSPPGGGTSPRGVALVYAKASGRDALSITATGLQPTVGHGVYAVWASAWLSEAHSAKLVGIVQPSVGRSGKLNLQVLLPRGASGSYQLLITLQRAGSAKAPGATVLEGGISL
jgi:hypothetical protein